MLFFDWNFPISNNKLKLLFPEGDLNAALNAKYVLPKHPAVIYPGVRGRNIQKEFREWLIKCHEVCMCVNMYVARSFLFLVTWGGTSPLGFCFIGVFSFRRRLACCKNRSAVLKFPPDFVYSVYRIVVQTLDIEYRFEDKMPTPAASKYDKWRKMTFGKGDSTFVSDSRVKLPHMKPIVYGVINYFRTEVRILLHRCHDNSVGTL